MLDKIKSIIVSKFVEKTIKGGVKVFVGVLVSQKVKAILASFGVNLNVDEVTFNAAVTGFLIAVLNSAKQKYPSLAKVL